MSEVGPHDTLHLEWIIHICLRSRHIWGTYSQWQMDGKHACTFKMESVVYLWYMYSQNQTTKHDIARQ